MDDYRAEYHAEHLNFYLFNILNEVRQTLQVEAPTYND
ncbi:hypothetical protein N643_07965 [Salmonella bongori serovar 48:z41:-- str. RKS3044]|nr:hypothetical protein N643_07965 [Salmonella bongori serovar 48:z41:-- str. RKS3044]